MLLWYLLKPLENVKKTSVDDFHNRYLPYIFAVWKHVDWKTTWKEVLIEISEKIKLLGF